MSAPNLRVFGNYVLLKHLGSGAAGSVHLARPLELRSGLPSPLVIKRLHEHVTSLKEFTQRFEHEANVAVRVDSPHVAKVFDVGAVGRTLYIALEHIFGWPLNDVLNRCIERRFQLPIGVAVALVVDALTGLEALHEAKDEESGELLGIVHRDLSPRNQMVDETGRLKLIDLGLGKSNLQEWRTRTDLVMGTLGYMAPEQAAKERVDLRADLYAVAISFFEALVLEPYIPRREGPAMLRAMAAPKFRRPSSSRPEIPALLDSILERALQPDPDRRFQSAAEFKAALSPLWTEKAERDSSKAIVERLLGDELRVKKVEVRELLLAELPAGAEPEEVKTIIFAQASFVRTSRGVLPDPPRAISIDPTLTMKTDLDESPTQLGDPPDSAATERRPGPRFSEAITETRPRRQGVPPVGVVGLVVVAVAATLTLDRWLLSSDPRRDEVPPSAVHEPAPAAPRPFSAVLAEPRVAQPQRLEAEPEDRPSARSQPERPLEAERSAVARPETKRPPPRVSPLPPAQEPAPELAIPSPKSPSPDPEVRVRNLTSRANLLLKANPARRQEIGELIWKITTESKRDSAAANKALDTIESELDRIAAE